jgi:hypothetical protein
VRVPACHTFGRSWRRCAPVTTPEPAHLVTGVQQSREGALGLDAAVLEEENPIGAAEHGGGQVGKDKIGLCVSGLFMPCSALFTPCSGTCSSVLFLLDS